MRANMSVHINKLSCLPYYHVFLCMCARTIIAVVSLLVSPGLYHTMKQYINYHYLPLHAPSTCVVLVRCHDDWFIFSTGAGGRSCSLKKPRKHKAKRVKGAKCLSEMVRILSWRAKALCGVNPLVSEAGWVTFLPHLKKVNL